MKLEHFRYLLEVNRLHSISAAARALHIRQTTLSATVKAAEEELGFPIFQRAPTGVAVTPAGEQFMALAWEISVKYEELLSLKRRAAGGSQAITILLAPSIAPSLPVPLTSRFHQYELRGNLTFEEHLSVEIGERLVDNVANIGVAYLTPKELEQFRPEAEKNKIEVERLLEDQIYLMVAKDHPFAALEAVDADLIRTQRLATAKTIRDDAILGKAMLNCARITTFSDIDIMRQAVLEQGMAAFLPGFTIRTGEGAVAPSRFCVRPVRGTEKENRLYLCLLYREENALRYQEKILAACIREYFWDFLGRHPEFAPKERGGEPR